MTTTDPTRCCYLITADPNGDISARQVAASAATLPAIGEIAVENQGDDPVSMWEAARDALGAVMPDPDDE